MTPAFILNVSLRLRPPASTPNDCPNWGFNRLKDPSKRRKATYR